jgi:hypothetical protein
VPHNPRSFRATNLIGSFQDDGDEKGAQTGMSTLLKTVLKAWVWW